MQALVVAASAFGCASASLRVRRLASVVEVPGIEPGSLGEDLVILRAQFALAFLCPDVHANKMSTGTVTVRFSVRTRDRFRW